MATESTRVKDIKSRVSIPQYFYNIILNQRSSYYDDYKVDFDISSVAKCPIHDENTPSMRYYEDTNTFYCFGCGAGGDIINLHRKYTYRMTGDYPSFEQSVDFLYDMFIRGKDITRVIQNKRKSSQEKPLSSQVDIIKYSKYSSTLEGQLLCDESIDIKSKETLWGLLDLTNLLIDKNKISAQEAIDYLKKKVAEVLSSIG